MRPFIITDVCVDVLCWVWFVVGQCKVSDTAGRL